MRNTYAARFMTAIVVVLITVCATAAAGQDSFNGIPWGAAPTAFGDLVNISREGSLAYYRREKDALSLAGIAPVKVVYGFVDKRFFAVYILLQPKTLITKIKQFIADDFGPPRAQLRIDRTIYIWKAERLKVKLKVYDDQPFFKVAYYYVPLSAKLNENRIEKGFEKSFSLKTDLDR